MNWSDLPVLLAVVETGSFSAAARRLRLSQPTVGRRIAALEQQFGKALLVNDGKSLSLTPTGEKVVAHARNMDDAASALIRDVEADEDVMAGPITVSTTQGLGDYWLPRILLELCNEYPQLQPNVDIRPEAVNLARREADIALRWIGPGNQNSLIGRKVLDVGIGLYAASNYLQSHGRPQSLLDLGNHDVVDLQFANGQRAWDPVDVLPEGTKAPRSRFASNSFQAHETAIASGFGIGPMPHAQASWVQGVERILPEVEEVQELWIVAHSDLTRSPRIRVVFDYLVSALKADAEYFRTGELGRWGDMLAHKFAPATD